jgi:hypothetical protein
MSQKKFAVFGYDDDDDYDDFRDPEGSVAYSQELAVDIIRSHIISAKVDTSRVYS